MNHYEIHRRAEQRSAQSPDSVVVALAFSGEHPDDTPPQPPGQNPGTPVQEPPDKPISVPDAPVREPGPAPPKKYG
jgi:hypothetical protein